MGYNNANYILNALAQEDITHFFMVPGKLINPFMSCYKLDQAHPAIKPIVCAHEEGAAFMADGYARASGKIGVCFTIGGPGTTNALTAMAAAYTDRSPLLLISGQIPSKWEMRGALQDASQSMFNLIDMVKPVASSSFHVHNATTLPRYFNRTLHTLYTTQRPCYLSLPEECLLDNSNHRHTIISHGARSHRIIDAKRADELIAKLGTSARMAILVGSFARSEALTPLLVDLAEKYNVPVATTVSAKGIFPEDHPLSLGCFGYMGSRRSSQVLSIDNVDYIIRIGFDYTQWNTMAWRDDFISCDFIDVYDDIDLVNPSDVIGDTIVSDYCTFVTHLIDHGALLHQQQHERSAWLKNIMAIEKYYDIENTQFNEKVLHPAYIVKQLRTIFPRDTVLYVDSGTHRAFTGHYWESFGPYDYFSTTTIGPMGWAIPASIGGKLARPDQPVLTITGDGCMLMHGTEIQTAAKYNIDVTFVVINNSYYGQTYFNNIDNMKELSDLPDHDFSMFAQALGVPSFRVSSSDAVVETIMKAREIKGPKLIEFLVSHEHKTPIYDYKEAASARKDKEPFPTVKKATHEVSHA
ncbi:thiamine pyrophosphate-binding protein [Paludibacterium purpuratum]|uniref:Acetolactate synthase-1/2/3 large subunit n=1 Tax=Paludibacterium purpuratum TaxID=1144873 RepID=A0A4R7BGA3_9NEIS|nr:thiamine pyrophosphate-binding protein [Paludibacterium purpuratum]TDR82746.1 acetolactate synthase-1/2/3 large subunit [Paludibacterium purpuratum]